MPPSRIHSAIQGNNVCTSPFYAEEGWWATHMHELPRVKRQIPQESVFRFIPSFYPQVLVRHGQHATGGESTQESPQVGHANRPAHIGETRASFTNSRMHCRRGPQSGQKDESGDSCIGLCHIRHSVSPQMNRSATGSPSLSILARVGSQAYRIEFPTG
jgi:hypothetical protein